MWKVTGGFIQSWGQQELSGQLTPRHGVTINHGTIQASGSDPGLLLPCIPSSAEASIALHLGLKASHAIWAQLFFSRESARNFTEQHSVWVRVTEGENDLYLTFPGPGFNCRLRLDLGDRSGEFRLRSLEVRGSGY